MKTWKKVAIGAGILVAAGISYGIVSYELNKGVVTVQSGRVVRQDLTSIVTASGEIRPKNYTNVMGEGFGKITEINVKEGDHIKKGDVLLHLENIQPGADVQAQIASISAAEAGMRGADANSQSAIATLAQRTSDLEKAKFDWERSQQLYKEQLISKQDYDATRAVYNGATAALNASQAQVEQTRAAREQARSNAAQSRAVLTHTQDVLRKTTYTAPIDGIVTYIAVRVGENVVPGIQNATGSYLMTISDMSVVTSEVMVDETDIVSVRLGEDAEVTIDAIPGKFFKGKVTEVGTQAVLRSSGLASTQSTTGNQEAKDFKVVVTLQNPPDGLRPGLSSTAKITTAQRKNVLTVPIQALAERTKKDLEEAARENGQTSVTLAADRPASSGASDASGSTSALEKNPE